MGMDPAGRVVSITAFVGYMHRLWVARTGEKAPFWVTLFFWMRGDGGWISNPFICHQGAAITGEMLHGFFGSVPDDWVTHATPSGYADYAFFRKCMESLCEHAEFKPSHVLVDAHYSREQKEVWDKAEEKIYLVSF